MHFETKYGFGDVVYLATTENLPTQKVCPECNGEKGFAVVGKDFKAACRRCKHNGYGNPVGYIVEYNITPAYKKLTIGQVRLEITDSPGSGEHLGGIFSQDSSGETNYSPKNSRVEQYMACETGIGSGSIYYVEDLFKTQEAALEKAAGRVLEEKQRRAEEAERDRKRQSEYADIVEGETT